MNNYDGSKVGVPYVRVPRLIVDWLDNGQTPVATIVNALGVKLADGSVRNLEDLATITQALDFSKGDEPIPLVNPNDGSRLGMDTTLNQAFLAVLAVIRQTQIQAETPN